MTPSELRAALIIINASQSEIARVLGVRDRTVRNWIAGTSPVPAPAAKLLTLMRLGLLSPEHVKHV